MAHKRVNKKLLAAALVAHVLVTAVVWRDIDRRPASGLRGSKNLWRAVTALNTGNSLVYLLFGRRWGGAPIGIDAHGG